MSCVSTCMVSRLQLCTDSVPLALGKDDVQLSVQCPTSLLAVFEEYGHKTEVRPSLLQCHLSNTEQRVKEATDPFDLVFDLRDLSVSVEHLLLDSAACALDTAAHSRAPCNSEAQLLLKSYFLTNRRVRGASM